MKRYINKKNSGYSLIEAMVSISIFLVVVTFGIGSILSSYSVFNRTSSTRSIMDSLNFVMEDMARNIRVGYNYRCYTNPNNYEYVIHFYFVREYLSRSAE